jgi:hypothetical protein
MCTKFQNSVKRVKVLLLLIIVGSILSLSSCSFETYECHAYGNTNNSTKHGNKAQTHYAKKYK